MIFSLLQRDPRSSENGTGTELGLESIFVQVKRFSLMRK